MGFAHILEQHAEEATEGWNARNRAAYAPHYTRADLTRLDERVEANLEGLRLGGEGGAKAASALPLESAGAAFTRVVLALSRRDAKAFAKVLDGIEAEEELAQGVVGALGWVSLDVSAWARRVLVHSSCPPILRRFALAAHVAHRSDPGPLLDDAIRSTSAPLRAVAIEAAGLLGRVDLLPELRDDVENADAPVRRAATVAASLLDEEAAYEAVWSYADADSPRGRLALTIAIARHEPRRTREVLLECARDEARARVAVVGAGIDGAPEWIPFLLERLDHPGLSRLAGEALHRISGVRVEGRLKGEAPADAPRIGPTDDPNDTSVAPDPDGALPWPNAAAVRAANADTAARARGAPRLLLGQPSGPAAWAIALATGSQRLRAEVAVEQTAATGGELMDVASPGFRVRRARVKRRR